jgi:polysaccharide biosynthesis transport protein
MDFNQYMTALRARRKAFLLVFIVVVAAAVSVAMIVPKKYVASATVHLDVRDEQTMTPRAGSRERASYIATQVDLIKSGRVATQVVKDLKLASKPGVRDEWEKATGGSIPVEDWIASNLLEKLVVDVTASYVASVTFSSDNPRFAADVANGFAKAYVDTTLALRTEPTREAAEWFEGQMKGMRAQVSQAQSKLVSYQKAKGIVSVDERADTDSTRLAELSTQYLAAKNATYEAQSRYKQAMEAFSSAATGGTISPDAIPEVLTSTHISALKADLTRAEGRLEQESNVLGENHPQYVRTKAEANALREKISSEVKKLVASLGNAAESARKREDELKNAVAAANERVQMMKEARAELAVMTRDVENAQRAYDAVLTRFMTNKVESAAKSTNVALLSPAIEPLKPTQPKVGLISALAVMIGALLAGGIVYVLETLDRRVRSRSDLESRLAVPSLGLLSKWQPTGARLLPAPQRSAGALPKPW